MIAALLALLAGPAPGAPADRDGDGVPDADEAPGDTDQDGTPDVDDPDDDDDGFPTQLEVLNAEIANGAGDLDTDDDGVDDHRDLDSDGDRLPDSTGEDLSDDDGDGLPAYLDPDDDQDGVPTADELQDLVFPADPADAPDTDLDALPDHLDPDDDGDAIPTATEGGFDTDTDDDGTPDHLDADADGDGIEDAVELLSDGDGDGIPAYVDDDSDGDGFADRDEGAGDSDGDGVPDREDTDDDDDTVASIDERRGDTDEDGWDDRVDIDDDDDRIDTVVERADTDALGESDRDRDGFDAWADADADGDGVPDRAERREDFDGDGVLDYLDPDGAYTERFRGSGLAVACDTGVGGAAAVGAVAVAALAALRRRRRLPVLLLSLTVALLGGRPASAAVGDEISASRGRKGGVVVLYPRVVPATQDPEIDALAKRLQARLQSAAAATAVPPSRIDVRPAPERVCPRAGCRATSLGLMLGHQDGGCAVLAIVGPPGPETQRLVPLAGKFQMADAALPFRGAPEDEVVVSEFVPCSEVEAALDPAALGQLLAGSVPDAPQASAPAVAP